MCGSMVALAVCTQAVTQLRAPYRVTVTVTETLIVRPAPAFSANASCVLLCDAAPTMQDNGLKIIVGFIKVD
jgi:hypothetical protein